jgi:hypothetical protein
MTAKRYVFLSYGRKDVYPQGATNPVEQESFLLLLRRDDKRREARLNSRRGRRR